MPALMLWMARPVGTRVPWMWVLLRPSWIRRGRTCKRLRDGLEALRLSLIEVVNLSALDDPNGQQVTSACGQQGHQDWYPCGRDDVGADQEADASPGDCDRIEAHPVEVTAFRVVERCDVDLQAPHEQVIEHENACDWRKHVPEQADV